MTIIDRKLSSSEKDGTSGSFDINRFHRVQLEYVRNRNGTLHHRLGHDWLCICGHRIFTITNKWLRLYIRQCVVVHIVRHFYIQTISNGKITKRNDSSSNECKAWFQSIIAIQLISH